MAITRKQIKVNKHNFTLEIYPVRDGSYGKEGPFWEIFPEDYKACLYAFSNKDKLTKKVKDKYL